MCKNFCFGEEIGCFFCWIIGVCVFLYISDLNVILCCFLYFIYFIYDCKEIDDFFGKKVKNKEWYFREIILLYDILCKCGDFIF